MLFRSEPEDRRRLGANRFPDAKFARTLTHRHQHDVTHPDNPRHQRTNAYNPNEDENPVHHHGEHPDVLPHIPYPQSPFVRRVELMTAEKYVPLIELNFSNSLNPRNRNVKEGWNLVPEYKNLWNKFKKEFETLNSEDFESVLAVLRKYTSTIPAAVYTSESDISLYDHLKTTTARSGMSKPKWA